MVCYNEHSGRKLMSLPIQKPKVMLRATINNDKDKKKKIIKTLKKEKWKKKLLTVTSTQERYNCCQETLFIHSKTKGKIQLNFRSSDPIWHQTNTLFSLYSLSLWGCFSSLWGCFSLHICIWQYMYICVFLNFIFFIKYNHKE